MVKIDIRADVKALRKDLDALARKQLPFAIARAATATAKKVQAAEGAAILKAIPTATPFTQKSVGVIPARKQNLTATVFVKDIAAAYLEPFEFGGPHFLGKKKGLLVPKAQRVNQYGNLTKGTVARLKGKPNIFVGPVTFKKSGQTVWGVWQRPVVGSRRDGVKGVKGNTQAIAGGVRSGLKLLIRAEDPMPVKQRLGYMATAKRVVDATFKAELAKALAEAMKTTR